MKKKAVYGSLILFMIVMIYSLFLLLEKYNICILLVTGLISIISAIVCTSLYKQQLPKITILKKQDIFPFTCFILSNLLIMIIIQKNNFDSMIIGLIIAQIIASILNYFFISKEYDKQKSVFSLILLTLVNILCAYHLSTKLISLSLLASGCLALTCCFDIEAIYRKQNFLFMGLIGVLLAMMYMVLPGSIFYALFIILIISRKRGIKSAIKLSTALIICFLLTLIAINFIKIPEVNQVYLIKNNNINSYISCFCLLFFIVSALLGSIYSFRKFERKMGYLCRCFIIINLIYCFVFDKGNIDLYLTSYFPVYILLLVNIYDNLPVIIKKEISIYKQSARPLQLTKLKKISAVIPNYNYANYLNERIDSILLQTYPISELIILDDVSKDNSVEVIENKIKEIKEDYPDLPVKFIKNKENSGNVFKQWAKCFEVSTNDFLWICEADDSANRYFLENVMKAFDNDDVVISYSESLTMDENNKLLMPDLRPWIDIYHCGKWNKSYIISGKEELTTTMCINNTIANASGVVFRKKENIDYLKYLKTAEEFKLAGDWYFYAKVLESGSIAYCKKSLNYHRMHSKSVTLTTKDDLHYKEICRIQDMIMNKYKLKKGVKDLVLDRRENTKHRFALGNEELRLLDIPFEKILKESKVTDEVLLSIIIPVYNTEKYLRKCLDSALTNIPPKTEVLIINDGSPDNSDKIAKEYEKKYKNIVKYYKKKNGGLATAKNYGLEKAKGRYIIYLDSDDFVSHNMYMTMLKKALETNADMVCCDMFEDFEDGTRNYIAMTNDKRKSKFMQMIDVPLMSTSCNKIVKRNLYENLKYPEGLNNEDVAVTPVLYVKSQKIEKVDSPFYHYLQRDGSIQNSKFSKKRFVIFDTAKLCFEQIEKINKKHLDEIKGSIYTHQILGLLMFVITRQKRKERLELIKIFCDKMNEFNDFATNKYVLEYMEQYHLPNLIDYIVNKEINKIDIYLQIKMR